MANADQYRRALQNLLPRGDAWPTDENANLTKLCDARAQEYARLDAAAIDALNEVFPDTTVKMLPDWERVAGLPNPCTGLADTIQDRRKDLIAKLTSTGGQSPAYMIEIAKNLGYDITITEYRPFRAGISSVEQPLCGEEWWFVWQVNAPETTVTYFRAGQSAVGEPLAIWGNTRLECVLSQLNPGHTLVLFAYS